MFYAFPPARQRKVSRIADFSYFIIFLIGLPLADFLSSVFFCWGGNFFIQLQLKVQTSTTVFLI